MELDKVNTTIAEIYSSLSPVNKKIANYFLTNPDEIVFYNIVSLSQILQISPSSIFKFAKLLGLTGFKELQNIYRMHLVQTSVEGGFSEKHSALKQSVALTTKYDLQRVIDDIVKQDLLALEQMRKHIDVADVERAISKMLAADTIYIAGQLRSESIANWLCYTLTMLGKKNRLLNASAAAMHGAQGKFIGCNDVLMSISFQFYSELVIQTTNTARQNKCNIIAITDGDASPLQPLADVCFSLPYKEYLFSKSLTAAMSLALILTTGLAQKFKSYEKTNI